MVGGFGQKALVGVIRQTKQCAFMRQKYFIAVTIVITIIIIIIINTGLERPPTTAKSLEGSRPDLAQPHIVIVLADDYGYHDIGYHGSEFQTPFLDALAASGVILDNYYVQPVCTPTRSQLMSGRYQIHTGLQHGVLGHCQANGLPTDSPTLADKLKESGYATHLVGKWHLGFYMKEYLPHNRGFDSFYGFLGGMEDHYDHSFGHGDKSYLDLWDNNEPVRNETGHYSTHLFTSKAIDVIRSHDMAKPLFLYLAYQAVHLPWQVPEAYTRRHEHIADSRRRTYAGMVSAMDEGIGNVTQAMMDRGMWNNTVFIFSTDNGGLIASGASNFPLRGYKRSLFEGGIRGIGFVSGGAVKRSGAVSKDLIHVSDWFPTLVKLAGGNLNGTKPLDGVDQWSTINNGSPSGRSVLLHNIDTLAKRIGERLHNDSWDTRVRAAVREGDLKLITGHAGDGNWHLPKDGREYSQPKNMDPPDKNVWLFNISADPSEHHDLSGEQPDVVVRMLKLLVEFNWTAVAPRFPDSDPECHPARHGDVWAPWR